MVAIKNADRITRRLGKLMEFTDITKHTPGIFGSVGPWTVEAEEGPLMDILYTLHSSVNP